MKKLYGLKIGVLALGITAFVGCGSGEHLTSDIKVTNGKVISEKSFPQVVLLRMQTKNGQAAICSGTFVTQTTVLTAAHCVNGGDTDEVGRVDMEVQLGGESAHDGLATGIVSTEVFRNSEWDNTGGGVNANDLGIVRFPQGFASRVAKIRRTPVTEGENITIVGYGINAVEDRTSSGVKRMGTNILREKTDGFLHFYGTPNNTYANGEDSASGSGDSGGPMFDSNGQLIGVTSGGFTKAGKKHSLYVDLTTSSSKAFLKRFIRM